MELALVFGIFIAGIAASLLWEVTLLAPLLLGFLLFSGLALRRGFTVRELGRMVKESFSESFVVVGVLLLIGALTGLWRISGTVACFVRLGLSALPPSLFLLEAFLLTAVMSYALGTSFGVTATAGVILMSIARAGGVNPVLTAGACLSGVYVGDRGSPAASSANLVAIVTKTDLRKNIRAMLKNAAVPFLLCCLLYAVLSRGNALQTAESGTVAAMEKEFCLGWMCLLPALFMLVLPFCKVPVRLSMAVSIAAAFVLAVTLQDRSVAETLRCMLLGYTPREAALTEVLSGGGVLSMLEVCGILIVSCTYGSIFRRTGMLNGLTARLARAGERWGRFPVMLALSVGVSMVFCNQTIGILMLNQLSEGMYRPGENHAKMMDIENTVILTAGLVPWCIACSVPLGMLGVGYGAVPAAFFLWLLPLGELLRFFWKNRNRWSAGARQRKPKP